MRYSTWCFYVIKDKLLHSSEFKAYWDRRPQIENECDDIFFCRYDFCDYILDEGFSIDSYQGDMFKGYISDNMNLNMKKLIQCERIPFAPINAFATDTKEFSLDMNYAKDPRQTLSYINSNTEYDSNLIWDYILRTKNLSDIWDQSQLEYVVPNSIVERTYTYSKKIAAILHIYYIDVVEIIAEYCSHFPQNTDFYITTIQDETKDKIIEEFKKRNLIFECKCRPNVGVAMSTLWITYANMVTNGEYEYICYFHDKKSLYTQFSVHGEQFAERCYENLFGSPEIVKNIINLFEDNPRMGVLGPPMIYHGHYFFISWRNWDGNFSNTVELANKLKLHVDIDRKKMPVAPYGDMFWFRADALKKVIGHGFTYEDFNVPYAPDCTKLHAIERIYGFAAQDSGYYYADVISSENARSDLVNYQYMLYKHCQSIQKHGFEPGYFSESLKGLDFLLSFKGALKTLLKMYCPKPVWNFMRRIYKMNKDKM